jgi:C4-dicarboxylate-specific signal transduction histidine kinase
MKDKMDLIGRTGLKFFGTMTASISHDIKNVLAIMNENAGLIKDLTFMSKKGAPLDLEKVEGLATRFEQQIRRADDIVKGLNQFAHCVDAEEKPVEVGEAMALVLSLATRFIAMKNLVIGFTPPADSCRINANPFLLDNLLWFCLAYALENHGPEKAVEIRCKNLDNRVAVSFTGIRALDREQNESLLFSEAGEALARCLGAEIALDSNTNTMILGLVKDQPGH